jgi:phage gp37-like protein
MSELLTLRGAMATQIDARLGSGWDVEPHLGRFTDEELKLFMAKAPAVRVAVLGLGKPTEIPDASAADYPTTIGVYVVTKDGSTKFSRDEQAIAAVEAILLLADRNRWGCGQFCRSCTPRGARNLYSDKGLRDGVALWAIELDAVVRLAPPDPATYTMTALYLGQAPNVGQTHVDDYTLIAGAAPSEGAPS